MCGIFFYLGDRPHEDVYANFMKIKARGPNNSHVITENNMFFGFHRLMINDLTYAGDQPMIYNESMLLCNGEIYNFKQLVSKYNLHCRSHSDCEVILHLYEHLKSKDIVYEEIVKTLCQELDGEFAFIIYDKDMGRIIAARDRYGVRPLFVGHNGISLGLASELKALDEFANDVSQFMPSMFAIFNVHDLGDHMCDYYNLISEPYDVNNVHEETILQQIRQNLTAAVEKRLMSDMPLCALLSGGLDSSLVCGILAKRLPKGMLHTFSIGMQGSSDLKYARIVADYIGSTHHEVVVTEEDMLQAIPEVVRVIESYDITTVRASTPNYLIAKHIKDNTNFKVVLSGEMSDECNSSYLYFKKAPTPDALHAETNRLLEDVCYFDNLRADRSISSNGLEARVPFSDHAYIKLIQSVNPVLRMCNNKIEKYLLRKAFDGENVIPDEVLYRTKNAFSDAVSKVERSWFEIIQEHVDTLISDEEYEQNKDKYKHCTPTTKEAYYYRKLFSTYYQNDKVVPYFWLPRWCGDVQNPSARVLKELYSE